MKLKDFRAFRNATDDELVAFQNDNRRTPTVVALLRFKTLKTAQRTTMESSRKGAITTPTARVGRL
jgi:hypothetical protein